MSSGIMVVDEQKLRRSLHDRLEAALGADEAALLMDYLPPVGWADVARKADLDHLALVTKQDLDHLAVATKQDLDHLAVATTTGLDALYDKLHAEIADLKSALLMWLIPTWIASMGLAIAVARFT